MGRFAKLSRAEFESLLNSCAVKQPPKRRAGGKRSERTVPDDTPTARIQHLLMTQAAMDPSRAAAEITNQLVRQGFAASKIPGLRGRPFTDWLLALFQTVPASQVMHAALQIKGRVA